MKRIFVVMDARGIGEKGRRGETTDQTDKTDVDCYGCKGHRGAIPHNPPWCPRITQIFADNYNRCRSRSRCRSRVVSPCMSLITTTNNANLHE